MGFLCAVLVVIMHVQWPQGTPGSPVWFFHQGIAEGVARMAVPFFFIASGFFLARHFDERGWWFRETGKRVKSLGVPYVAWTLAALLASILLTAVANASAHRSVGTGLHFPHLRGWMDIFGLNLPVYPLNIPLWFLRCLFLLVLLSPVLDRLLARWGYAWLAVAFLFLLSSPRIPAGHWSMYLYHLSLGLFYFSSGIALRRMPPPELPRETACVSGVAGLALLALKMCAVWKGWPVDRELDALSLPFLLHAAWTFAPRTEWPDWLVSCAFPVYLANIVAIRLVTPFLLHAGLEGLPVAFAQLLAGVAGPCTMAWFLRRHFPGLAAMVFGGR